MSIRNLSRYASMTVPRYTSYPPAPHFSPAIGAASYADWLASIGPQEATSLYFHVPYCTAICAYCGCFTKASRKVEPILAYGMTLAREVALVGRHLKARPRVTHMHWGGGTPSLMPHEAFVEVLRQVNLAFDLGSVEEHAIELDPRVVTPRLAFELKAYGVTRVSLGVQDLNARVQQAIGRVQPLEVVERALGALRAAKLEAINMDVMYGLPKQSMEDVVRSVTACAALGADRIALFGYAHVPWMKKNQTMIKDADLPSSGARLEQARAAHKALEHLGYISIGFDHFARPQDPMAQAMLEGSLRRNFQGYTTDNAPHLIGLGASSIGRTQGGFAQNAADIGGWTRSVEAGQLATSRGYAMRQEDEVRGQIIEALLTQFQVDLSQPRAGFQPDQAWINEQIIALDDLLDDGLCTVSGSLVQIPVDARFLARLVAHRFDGFASLSKAQHSVAV
jgi:oxygen-independent coproporphyrinogen III oxidase